MITHQSSAQKNEQYKEQHKEQSGAKIAPIFYRTVLSLGLMAGVATFAAQPLLATAAKHYERIVPTGLHSRVSAAEFDVLAKEQQRTFDPEFFKAALASKDEKVVTRALLALGRIGDPAAIPLLTPIVSSTTASYRHKRAAAAALGWIGDAKAAPALVKAYEGTNVIAIKNAAAKALAAVGESPARLEGYLAKANHPMLRAGLSEALGHALYRAAPAQAKGKKSLALSKGTWRSLLSNLEDTDADTARGAAFALYMAARKKAVVPSWVLKEVEDDLAKVVRAAKDNAGTKTSANKKSSASDKAGGTLDPYAAAYLIKMTAKYPERSKTFLTPLLKLPVNQAVQVEAARALFAAPKGGILSKQVADALADKRMRPAVKVAMIDAIAGRGKASPLVSAALKALAETPGDAEWARDRAIAARVTLAKPKQRLALIQPYLEGPHRKVALRALGKVSGREALVPLLAAAKSPDTADVTIALEVLAGFDRKAFSYRVKARAKSKDKNAEKYDPKPALGALCKQVLTRGDFVMTNHCANLIKTQGFAHLAAPLRTAYQAITKPQEFEAKVAILDALGSFTGKVSEGFLANAVQDSNVAVRTKALDIAKKLGMKRVVMKDSKDERVGTAVTPRPTMSRAQVNEALAGAMVFETQKGSFVIKPLATSPLTASYIYGLAKQNFYKGLPFHRVIANFVAQGGDPRKDGWGGTDRINPDEFQMTSHSRGTVGIATAGKDTGSCQIFVNLAPNIWLDGRYTVFGEVVEGMGVVDRLAPGDAILSSRVVPATAVSH